MAGGAMIRRLLAAAALVGAAVGCGAEPIGPPAPPAPEPPPRPVVVVHDGLRYEAVFVVKLEHTLAVRVTISNPGRATRTLRFGSTCVAYLRAYWYPLGGLVWDMADGKAGCRERLVEVVLAPGEARSFEAGVGSLSILDGRSDGSYRITSYLRPLERPELELNLGPVHLSDPVDR